MGFWSDVGNAVASGASAVGDFVEDTANAVADTVEDAIDWAVDGIQSGLQAGSEWLCRNAGTVGCWAGNIVGGLIGGALQGFQDLMHDFIDLFRDLANLVGSVLRLDFCGVVKDLGNFATDALDLGGDSLRLFTFGYFVGGVVKSFKRAQLITFVDDLVTRSFQNTPSRLATVRQRIGLDGGRFGLRLPAEHRVFRMDSNDVPLWRMHRDGIIDLYEMAGLLSFTSCSLKSHPNTVVKSVGSDGSDNWWPVTRWAIAKYLESNGRERRLRVYALSHRIVARNVDTAYRKLDEIGVILEWNDGRDFAWFRNYTHQPITENEYDFNTAQIEDLLSGPAYNRPEGINCNLLALAGFKLDIFGRVGGRDIMGTVVGNTSNECYDGPCQTPGRTDRCCNTINRGRSSGVIYRDAWIVANDFFQYVLPHEIGHYLGLCHCGHDGFQNIMWSPKESDILDFGLVSFYWESEPHFSLEDAKNAWRFIVDQMAACLAGEPELRLPPVPMWPTTRPLVATTSCAVTRELAREEIH